MATLTEQLEQKEKEFEEVKSRLSQAGISDDTYRALLKTKNELIADIQDLKIKIETPNPKPFIRSLNETTEL